MNEQRYIIILKADGGVQLHALESEDELTKEKLELYTESDRLVRYSAKHGMLICDYDSFLSKESCNTKATAIVKPDFYKIYGDAVLCKQNGRKLTGFLLGKAIQIVDSLEGRIEA